MTMSLGPELADRGAPPAERSAGDRCEAAGIRRAVLWLSLAAAPTFAAMALVSAADAGVETICSTPSRLLPISGMTGMYLLMSLFHLPPWLKLLPELK